MLEWPSPKDYGRRFDELNTKFGRIFALSEFRGESLEDCAVLQYRLAKIAIAAEDILRAVAILETDGVTDSSMAEAVVELRSACAEACDSFTEADPAIIRLLNFLSG